MFKSKQNSKIDIIYNRSKNIITITVVIIDVFKKHFHKSGILFNQNKIV